MEGAILLIALLLVAVIGSAVCGVIAFARQRTLRRDSVTMQRQIAALRLEVQQLRTGAASFARAPEVPAAPLGTHRPIAAASPQDPEPHTASADTPTRSTPAATDPEQAAADQHIRVNESATYAEPPYQPPATDQWLAHVKTHWMVWLGGLSVALAGVFLVKYSIDQGLLGPGARIAAAILGGLGLHALAEWLRRSRGGADALAALAGGASIMLYAALLAALHLYNLLAPGTVFALLVLVSMGTMALALIHGPVLAAMGLLGAYTVPILVSTGSQNLAGALIYSLIITVAALFLVRYVYRRWLWLGTLAGAMWWWLASLGSEQAQLVGMRSMYLAVLGYALVAIHYFDWALRKPVAMPGSPWAALLRGPPGHPQRILYALLALIGLQAITVLREPIGNHWYYALLALPLVLFMVSARKPLFSALPWISLLGVIAALLLRHLDLVAAPPQWMSIAPWHQAMLIQILLVTATFFSALSLWRLRAGEHKGTWASLACLAPVATLVPAYFLLPDMAAERIWIAAALLGLGYMGLVILAPAGALSGTVILSLAIAAHAAYSLAVALALEEASLTLALAGQILSLAWLRGRFDTLKLDWAIKALVIVVVIRLTLNPFLPTYPVHVHWSLWTYGGCLALVVAALALIPKAHKIRAWLLGSAMHLGVLLIGAEIRYQLYDGHIFAPRFTLTEAALNALVWGTMGLVYHWRVQLSDELGWLYQRASRILLWMAVACYVVGPLLLLNPVWGDGEVGTRPVLNILLLAYGAPALLLAIGYKYLQPRPAWLGAATGLSALIFSFMQIRHLWEPAMAWHLGTGSGEQYTYSVVWLAMAVVAILAAGRRAEQGWYRAGMVLLLAVTAKIFLIDMSDLQGLLRVASFMGLGLSLLGLAFLHQQLARPDAPSAQ